MSERVSSYTTGVFSVRNCATELSYDTHGNELSPLISSSNLISRLVNYIL